MAGLCRRGAMLHMGAQAMVPRTAVVVRPTYPTHPGSLRTAVVVCAAEKRESSKAPKADADAAGSSRSKRSSAASARQPYGDALLQREYELWQRQEEMYERLLTRHEREAERWAEERAQLLDSEAALRRELAELRAQLMYVMSAMGSGSGSSPTVDVQGQQAGGTSGSSRQAVVQGGAQPAGVLPASSGSGSGHGGSAAAEVHAVLQAARAGTLGYSSTPPEAPSPPQPAGTSQALGLAGELAAAIAAVDQGDVLQGLEFQQLREKLVREGADSSSSTASSAHAAAVPPPPAAAAPPHPPTAAVEPARAPEAEGGPDVSGPPPVLVLGDENLFWVNQLHTALVEAGYFPGEEDIEDVFFGGGTQSALSTMQACEGMEETGVADMESWVRLLGPTLRPLPSRDLSADLMLNIPGVTLPSAAAAAAAAGGTAAAPAASSTSTSVSAAASSSGGSYRELFSASFSEEATPGGGSQQWLEMHDTVVGPDGRTASDDVEARVDVGAAEGGGATVQTFTLTSSHSETFKNFHFTEFPVLQEGDGGRGVHALHVALERAGYYPDDDDIRWWNFGDSTVTAVKTFQACSGAPQSGICNVRTWKLLLGADATPADLEQLRTGDSGDEDLAEGGDHTRVWLMGEGRWEDRSRLSKKASG